MTDTFEKIIEDQKALDERRIQLLMADKGKADEERKIIAGLQSEREVAVKATAEAQDKRYEAEKATHEAEARNKKVQADYAASQALFEKLKRQLATVPTRAA